MSAQKVHMPHLEHDARDAVCNCGSYVVTWDPKEVTCRSKPCQRTRMAAWHLLMMRPSQMTDTQRAMLRRLLMAEVER